MEKIVNVHVCQIRAENLIRGLDDDEINFLEIVDKAKIDAERRQQIQEDNELSEFRQRVASLQEKSIEQVSFHHMVENCQNEFLFSWLFLSLLLEKRHINFKAESHESACETIAKVHFSWCCS